MITFNDNSICEQAQTHYYDYLCEETKECIPAETLRHIDKCQHCRAEVNRLKVVLAETEKCATENTGQTTSAITTNLGLHFAYIGVSVTCKTVKPFLSSLADPALEVGVPTPITVHLDNCQQCANDLEIIRQLNLPHKQLCRLGQLFSEKPAEDAVSCSQAQAAILAVVTMVFRETNAEVLRHLCTCPDCRDQLYKYRETVREQLLLVQRAQQEFPCEQVLPTDIFDYCLPYGIDPANDQYAKFRPAFTSHARACLKCLGKMQELHRTVYSMLERQESGIVTCFKMVDESFRGSIVRSPDDVYEDWPIEVQVFDKSKSEPNAVVFSQRLKQRLSAMNPRRFRIPAVAAIILIAVGLFFFSTPVAKAVNLGQIYKALERIRNVYITTFVPGESKPTQEVWISRALNIKLFKTETKWVLWDAAGKSRKTKDLNTTAITMMELDEGTLVKIEEAIEEPVGLLPFDDVSEVLKDAKWQQVADEAIETTIANTQVYDLIWTVKALGDGSIVYKKWRGYIDTETKLPKRIERWGKFSKKDEYELKTVINVDYPGAIEIQSVIRDAGF